MTSVRLDLDDRMTGLAEKMREQVAEHYKEQFLASLGITLNGEEKRELQTVETNKYAGVEGFGDF